MDDMYKETLSKDSNYMDTVFVKDIESRVFQAITVKCLSKIKGIALVEGTLFDNLLGREGLERVKGIYVEQDTKSHSISVKIELNVAYGIPIPQKSEEIQSKIVDDITTLSGLHVASVHVVFKNLLPEKDKNKLLEEQVKAASKESEISDDELNEYTEEF